jgi:hypothetical protein
MTHSEATDLLALLNTWVAPQPDSRGKQFIEYRRAERTGTAAQQLAALQILYATASPDDASRMLMIESLEGVLFPVLRTRP